MMMGDRENVLQGCSRVLKRQRGGCTNVDV